ncbi:MULTISPECIES: FAS1-like dehydratase domain-containing protein [Afifella]|uniref:FAS1-like dehydratase domain-containing protein n=1 Tax=Afifella TaxID=643217 RepID=UPI000FE2D8AC|nr:MULTISPECIES: MaoC family dehydratase N-terminal domain-containing protein [Afifella]MCT8268168.1 MaoC family dehydratase N-terminal domain-containing protein [Afifella sp. JA880]
MPPSTAAGTLDLEHLREWIGRSETVRDVVTPHLVAAFRATMDVEPGTPKPGEEAPAAIHWCLAPATVPMSGLGPDGHPSRGGFLPPVPLPRRMWAGGRLELEGPILVGDEVERRSVVRDVVRKEGRTGELCFVTVDHEISTSRGLAIRERQDLVYREAAPTSPAASPRSQQAAAKPSPEAPQAEQQKPVTADAVRLFRYSALTFNGHRIHYDRRYCIEEEGYPGLVVHGPMQATWLLHYAAELKGELPKTFDFRGVKPFFDGAPATLNATEKDDGLSLWVAADGAPTMQATAAW